MPFSVKENIDVAGTATTQAVTALVGARASVDAPAVANLRLAGAIPLARTNMPDFALRWHTDSAGADLRGPDAAQGIVDGLRATLVANVLGLPSVAVSVGVIDGLPQAVQVIGPRFGDTICLDAAEAIERAVGRMPPVDPRPTIRETD